jgi:hypothetical protein
MWKLPSSPKQEENHKQLLTCERQCNCTSRSEHFVIQYWSKVRSAGAAEIRRSSFLTTVVRLLINRGYPRAIRGSATMPAWGVSDNYPRKHRGESGKSPNRKRTSPEVTSMQVFEYIGEQWKSLLVVCLAQGGVSCFNGSDWPLFCPCKGEQNWLLLIPRVKAA